MTLSTLNPMTWTPNVDTSNGWNSPRISFPLAEKALLENPVSLDFARNMMTSQAAIMANYGRFMGDSARARVGGGQVNLGDADELIRQAGLLTMMSAPLSGPGAIPVWWTGFFMASGMMSPGRF